MLIYACPKIITCCNIAIIPYLYIMFFTQWYYKTHKCFYVFCIRMTIANKEFNHNI